MKIDRRSVSSFITSTKGKGKLCKNRRERKYLIFQSTNPNYFQLNGTCRFLRVNRDSVASPNEDSHLSRDPRQARSLAQFSSAFLLEFSIRQLYFVLLRTIASTNVSQNDVYTYKHDVCLSINNSYDENAQSRVLISASENPKGFKWYTPLFIF